MLQEDKQNLVELNVHGEEDEEYVTAAVCACQQRYQ